MISFLIMVVVSLSMVTSASAASYPDVPEDYQFSKEINYLSDEGIISGFPDGTFRYNATVTRAQAAVMLGKVLELDGELQSTDFPDVSQDHYAFGYIKGMAELDVITGFPDGTFRPDDPVTRGQMAKMLADTLNLEETSTITFSDVPSDHWTYEYVQKIYTAQITAGYPDNTYQPNKELNRGEFSAFVYRSVTDDKPDVVKQGDLEVHFLDVGQGDSSLIITPDGSTILVDASTSTHGEKIVSYLKKAGITTIDHVVATHAHADHIGGMVDVLQNFDIGTVYDSGVSHTSQTYLDYLEYIDQQNINFVVPEEGDSLISNDDYNLSGEFINVGDVDEDLNNSSIAFQLTYKESTFTFTGDAESQVEQDMVQEGNLQDTDVYKVAHHGSNTSSSDTFIESIDPEYAVFSYGEDNSYGHPHSNVVEKLQSRNVELYSTAVQGDIVFTTDGYSYDINVPKWDPQINEGQNEEPPSEDGDHSVSYPININTADYETLQAITGVGPTIAQRIIDYREANDGFDTIEEIINVKGIGDARFEDMKNQITVE